MFDKLEDILFRYDEVLKELSEPEVLNDAARYQKLMKEQLLDLMTIMMLQKRLR